MIDSDDDKSISASDPQDDYEERKSELSESDGSEHDIHKEGGK